MVFLSWRSAGKDEARRIKLVAFFLSVAVLFAATQYEIPLKLSMSTFHVSVMAR